MSKYKEEKSQILDSLQPDDFRNPASFNQVEEIIDQLVESAKKSLDPTQFIKKAVDGLLRENAPAKQSLVDLLNKSLDKDFII